MRLSTVLLLTGLLVLAGFTCPGAGVSAQEGPQSQPAPIAESAQRLARELWPVGEQASVDEEGRPRFRTSVEVSPFELPLPWYETDPAFVRFRGRGTLYHREFLSVVTPEAFRGGTLFSVGIAVDPGATFDGIKAIWRTWQARRVRERIEKEVEQLRARGTSAAPGVADR